jgi:hypothetical protein
VPTSTVAEKGSVDLLYHADPLDALMRKGTEAHCMTSTA